MPSDPTVLTIVQARMNSTRCPGKVLAPFGDCQTTMLGFLLERLANAVRAGTVVVATTERADDNPVCDLAARLGTPVIRGEEEDVLARFNRVLHSFPTAEVIVRVTGDNPFTCPSLLDAAVGGVMEDGYDYVITRDAPYGAGVDAFSRSALDTCISRAHAGSQREHINGYVLDNTAHFRILHQLAPAIVRRPDLRLTVDTPEDLRWAQQLAKEVDDGPAAPLSRVITCADRLGLGPNLG